MSATMNVADKESPQPTALSQPENPSLSSNPPTEKTPQHNSVTETENAPKKEINPVENSDKAGDSPSRPPFSSLNTSYTFETFVVGEGSRFAHAAARDVAKSPGQTQFNPLVIYGGVGLGKTHLLQAIGHYALSQGTAKKVTYVPSEKFLSDFIEAIGTRTQGEFRRNYRSADILLVDDIQFFIQGEHTQTEFFHTFNALHQNGKLIAMTCDSPPDQLEGMEERLISRFQW